MGTITREVFLNAQGEPVPRGDPSATTIEIGTNVFSPRTRLEPPRATTNRISSVA